MTVTAEIPRLLSSPISEGNNFSGGELSIPSEPTEIPMMSNSEATATAAAAPPTATATTSSKGTTTAEPKTKNAWSKGWGVPKQDLTTTTTTTKATTTRKTKTLSDIMAEQEEEETQKRQRQAREEEDEALLQKVMEQSLQTTVTTTTKKSQAELEEEEQLRLVMALSLAETTAPQQHKGDTEAKHTPADQGAQLKSWSPSENSGENANDAAGNTKNDVSVAVAASNPASTASASAAMPEANTGVDLESSPFLSQQEAESIARALREAEDAEAAASLQLAMTLQGEEDFDQKLPPSHDQGNVRTVHRHDFIRQQGRQNQQQKQAWVNHPHEDEEEEEEKEERLLWGKDDYELHQHHYYGSNSAPSAAVPSSSFPSEEPLIQNNAGFRMNSSTPSQSWSRLDRHTIIGPNGEIRTKHDVTLKSQSNAQRLLLDNGGLSRDSNSTLRNKPKKGGESFGISDRAYNGFRQAIKKRSVDKGVARFGAGRAEGEGIGKTRTGAMDDNVRLAVVAAINMGIIEQCHGAVKEGKEAVIYHANGKSPGHDDDEEKKNKMATFDVAVKVFKRIQEFKTRGAYVDGDPRYHSQKFKTVGKKAQLELWAEKEYRNLVRANRAGVPVPSPLLYKENILFMRFLGDDGWPSPQLREISIKKGSPKWTVLYCQTLVAVRRLYHCARLVHGDLSEYNILLCPSTQVENGSSSWLPNEEQAADKNVLLQIVLIDFAQAIERNHPMAMELLERDLSLVRNFFVKQGCPTLDLSSSIEFIVKPHEIPTEEEEEDLCDNNEKKLAQTFSDKDMPTPEDFNVDNNTTTTKKENNTTDENKNEMETENKAWRHTIAGWDDAKDFDSLQQMLSSHK